MNFIIPSMYKLFPCTRFSFLIIQSCVSDFKVCFMLSSLCSDPLTLTDSKTSRFWPMMLPALLISLLILQYSWWFRLSLMILLHHHTEILITVYVLYSGLKKKCQRVWCSWSTLHQHHSLGMSRSPLCRTCCRISWISSYYLENFPTFRDFWWILIQLEIFHQRHCSGWNDAGNVRVAVKGRFSFHNNMKCEKMWKNFPL